MNQWNIHGLDLSVCLDQTQLCSGDNRNVWIKTGAQTGEVIETKGTYAIPLGSLLFGELKITDAAKGEATVRYTLMQFPDGTKYPVCIESRVGSGVPSQPGALRAQSNVVQGNSHINRGWEKPW